MRVFSDLKNPTANSMIQTPLGFPSRGKMQEIVLVVDDEQSTRQVISTLLEIEGFKVVRATSGSDCLRKVSKYHPNLVLLDLVMPGQDGRVVCRRLREVSDVPIVILTALSDSYEIADRLTDGADDYVQKPFDNTVLLARIRTALRKHSSRRDFKSYYDDGYLRIDLVVHKVHLERKEVVLSVKELRLLECLVRNRDRTVPFAELLENVWDERFTDDHKILKVYIARLRGKLCENARRTCYIQNEHNSGYYFQSAKGR